MADDEPAVLLVIAAILNRCGYRVLTAPDGDKALQAFENAEDTIHLVLSDVVMPGMNGYQFVRLIQDVSPSTPVLLMSAACRLPSNCGVPAISKPFTRKHLIARVRSALRSCDFAQIEREQLHARSRERGNPGNRRENARQACPTLPDAPKRSRAGRRL